MLALVKNRLVSSMDQNRMKLAKCFPEKNLVCEGNKPFKARHVGSAMLATQTPDPSPEVKDVTQLLKEKLVLSVKALQKRYVASDAVVTSEDGDANLLCCTLEVIFIHGIESKHIRKKKGARGSLPQPVFWTLLKSVTHRDVISELEKLSFVSTDVGRCRAWLRLALNHGLLECYLVSLFREGSKLQAHYQPAALLLNPEEREVLMSYLQGLASLTFNLSYKSAVLNEWTTTPLVLAGLCPAAQADGLEPPTAVNGAASQPKESSWDTASQSSGSSDTVEVHRGGPGAVSVGKRAGALPASRTAMNSSNLSLDTTGSSQLSSSLSSDSFLQGQDPRSDLDLSPNGDGSTKRPPKDVLSDVRSCGHSSQDSMREEDSFVSSVGPDHTSDATAYSGSDSEIHGPPTPFPELADGATSSSPPHSEPASELVLVSSESRLDASSESRSDTKVAASKPVEEEHAIGYRKETEIFQKDTEVEVMKNPAECSSEPSANSLITVCSDPAFSHPASILGRQMSAESLSLLKEKLVLSVKALQNRYVASDAVVTSEDGDANLLCCTLEAIFIHGIESKHIRKKKGARGSLPQPVFWTLLKSVTHRDVISELEKLSFVSTDVGRCRAWLRLALNHGLLECYLVSLFREGSKLQAHYQPAALLLNPEEREVLMSYLQGLASLTFNLSYKSAVLNEWTTTPLVLAGLCPAAQADGLEPPTAVNGAASQPKESSWDTASQSSGSSDTVEVHRGGPGAVPVGKGAGVLPASRTAMNSSNLSLDTTGSSQLSSSLSSDSFLQGQAPRSDLDLSPNCDGSTKRPPKDVLSDVRSCGHSSQDSMREEDSFVSSVGPDHISDATAYSGSDSEIHGPPTPFLELHLQYSPSWISDDDIYKPHLEDVPDVEDHISDATAYSGSDSEIHGPPTPFPELADRTTSSSPPCSEPASCSEPALVLVSSESRLDASSESRSDTKVAASKPVEEEHAIGYRKETEIFQKDTEVEVMKNPAECSSEPSANSLRTVCSDPAFSHPASILCRQMSAESLSYSHSWISDDDIYKPHFEEVPDLEDHISDATAYSGSDSEIHGPPTPFPELADRTTSSSPPCSEPASCSEPVLVLVSSESRLDASSESCSDTKVAASKPVEEEHAIGYRKETEIFQKEVMKNPAECSSEPSANSLRTVCSDPAFSHLASILGRQMSAESLSYSHSWISDDDIYKPHLEEVPYLEESPASVNSLISPCSEPEGPQPPPSVIHRRQSSGSSDTVEVHRGGSGAVPVGKGAGALPASRTAMNSSNLSLDTTGSSQLSSSLSSDSFLQGQDPRSDLDLSPNGDGSTKRPPKDVLSDVRSCGHPSQDSMREEDSFVSSVGPDHISDATAYSGSDSEIQGPPTPFLELHLQYSPSWISDDDIYKPHLEEVPDLEESPASVNGLISPCSEPEGPQPPPSVIHRSLIANPFRGLLKLGHLEYNHGVLGRWRDYYCELSPFEFRLYLDAEERTGCENFSLLRCSEDARVTSTDGRFELAFSGKRLYLRAANHDEAEDWVDRIVEAVNKRRPTSRVDEQWPPRNGLNEPSPSSTSSTPSSPERGSSSVDVEGGGGCTAPPPLPPQVLDWTRSADSEPDAIKEAVLYFSPDADGRLWVRLVFSLSLEALKGFCVQEGRKFLRIGHPIEVIRDVVPAVSLGGESFFKILTCKETLRLRAESPEEARAWMDLIRGALPTSRVDEQYEVLRNGLNEPSPSSTSSTPSSPERGSSSVDVEGGGGCTAPPPLPLPPQVLDWTRSADSEPDAIKEAVLYFSPDADGQLWVRLVFSLSLESLKGFCVQEGRKFLRIGHPIEVIRDVVPVVSLGGESFFKILTCKETLRLRAESPEEARAWMDRIRGALDSYLDSLEDGLLEEPAVGGQGITGNVHRLVQQRLKGDGVLLAHLYTVPSVKGLDKQNFKCAGCPRQIGLSLGRVQLCEFSGQYYCDSCHLGDTTIIPARMVHNWDLTAREVSRKALRLLDEIEQEPLLNLEQLNPELMEHAEPMGQAHRLRQSLHLLGDYLLTCRSGACKKVQARLQQRTYLLESSHLYSVIDLRQIAAGQYVAYLSTLVQFASNHVYQCELCSQRGFYCQICNSNDVIYPFQVDSTTRCKDCKAVFHLACHAQSPSCPQCQRRKKYLDDLQG